MPTIVIATDACEATVVTDSAEVAVGWIAALFGLIDPAKWIEIVASVSPEWADSAQRIATICFGQGV